MMQFKSQKYNQQIIISVISRFYISLNYFIIIVNMLAFNCSSSFSQEMDGEFVRSGKIASPNLVQLNENSFKDTKSWARRLDGVDRDEWQKPNEVIDRLLVGNESVVADIGAGTGYFTTRIAARYPKSRLYAVDLSSEMLDYIKERANNEKLSNIHVVQADKSGPNLPEKVDLAILVNAYGHKDDPVNYFTMLKKYLKDDGRVALVFFNDEAERGPPKNMRISEATAIEYMQKAGYKLLFSHKIIPDEYFLIFTQK